MPVVYRYVIADYLAKVKQMAQPAHTVGLSDTLPHPSIFRYRLTIDFNYRVLYYLLQSIFCTHIRITLKRLNIKTHHTKPLLH